MKPPALDFNEERHEYRLDGRLVPSVTQVINSIAPQREVDEWYLHRGSAVHHAVALAMTDRLDWSSVDERIKGRVEAIMAFVADEKLTPILIEKRMASERYRFAGTVDLVANHPSLGVVIADWKGSIVPQSTVQLGAYSLLMEEAREVYPPLRDAVAVQCKDSGKYRCKWVDSRDLRLSRQTFLAFLTSHNWKLTHSPKNTPKNTHE